MKFTGVVERMKEVLGTSKDADLARDMGISSAAIANFKRRDTFPTELIYKFNKKHNTATPWLVVWVWNGVYCPDSSSHAENLIKQKIFAKVSNKPLVESVYMLLYADDKEGLAHDFLLLKKNRTVDLVYDGMLRSHGAEYSCTEALLRVLKAIKDSSLPFFEVQTTMDRISDLIGSESLDIEEIEPIISDAQPSNTTSWIEKIQKELDSEEKRRKLISPIIECHDNTWHLLELSTKEFEKGWVKKIIVFTFFDAPGESLQHGIMLNGDEVTKVISHCVFRSGYIGSGPKSFQEFIQQAKAHQIPIGEILVDSESAAMILKGEIPKIESLNIDYSVDFIEKYFTGKPKIRNPLEDPILCELIQTLEPLIDLPDDNKRFAVKAITHFVKGFLQKG